MGSLKLPPAGLVYADTQALVYTVERHPRYAPLMRPLWEAVQRGALHAVSSELALMETLIGPLKRNDAALAADYEQFLQHPNVSLAPITRAILREAARLRAAIPALRTPDALHAATAKLEGCALVISNDAGLRRVPNLPLVILDDLTAP